ncbi:YdcF family protein [Amphibacillus sp. MSJ-3]|uniref:YdcF family protein n=1 Tax=Amphibacillus sp. MSJ-3 TaxID=2841505 RepID=UPI001C0EADD6|nr:YdcF family protein [Amphibacillus sp. MSJ-3]MBU5594295.1 YdcF family protein [Amphibacillus sp. MSJ-3]
MVTLIVIVIIVLITAGNLLVRVDQLKESDAIIVLSGFEGRLEKGIKLFNEGYGSYLILSNSDDFDEDILREQGISEDLVILESRAESTFTNATLTKEIVLDREFRSVIIVTSEFHTSRARYIFKKVYQDTSVRLFFTGSKNRFFNSRFWWFNFRGIYVVAVEYVKWVYYLIRY